MNIIFKYERRYDKYKKLIAEFQKPENEDDQEFKTNHEVKNLFNEIVPKLMVEEQTLKMMREDPNNVFELSLSNFNQGFDEILYLGSLKLLSVIKNDKVEPLKVKRKLKYNVKILYYVRSEIPNVLIKINDQYAAEKMSLRVRHKDTIKALIRICSQDNEQMIVN